MANRITRFTPVRLSPDEKVILMTRESLRIRGVSWVLWAVWTFGLVLVWVVLRIRGAGGSTSLLQALVNGLLVLLMVMMIPIWLISFLRWWYRVYVVTDRRVIYRSGLLNVIRRDLSLDDVMTVTAVKEGLSKFLGVGHVQVMTAGLSGDVYMRHITAPDKVRELILQTQEHMRRHREQLEIEDIGKRLKETLRL